MVVVITECVSILYWLKVSSLCHLLMLVVVGHALIPFISFKKLYVIVLKMATLAQLH